MNTKFIIITALFCSNLIFSSQTPTQPSGQQPKHVTVTYIFFCACSAPVATTPKQPAQEGTEAINVLAQGLRKQFGIQPRQSTHKNEPQ